MSPLAPGTSASWELLETRAWTPTVLAAGFLAAGSELGRGAGRGAYLTGLFPLTGMAAALLAGPLADRSGRTPVIFALAAASAARSRLFGWLLGASLAFVVGVGLRYGLAGLGDSPIYSAAITEVVIPACRGSALALRSLPGDGAGAIAPRLFGAILDWRGVRSADAWGSELASLGLAGAGAVLAVGLLDRAPEAAVLRGRVAHGRPAVSGSAR